MMNCYAMRLPLLTVTIAAFHMIKLTSAFEARSKRKALESRSQHSARSSTTILNFDSAPSRHGTVFRRKVDYLRIHSLSAKPNQSPFDDEGYGTVVGEKSDVFSSSSADERQKGFLVLMTVPFAWGTFEPAVRFVYSIKPAVPGFVFSLSYYLVAAFSLLTMALLGTSKSQKRQENWPYFGGAELGFYLFLGNALQVLGLKTIPSDRAAFLLQLTTIFVPLMEAIIARNLLAVSRRTWFACAVAMFGVGVMSFDGNEGDILSPTSLDQLRLSLGDFYVIAAALAYTFHCIRLEGYAKNTSAVKLAATKASAETFLSALAIAGVVLYSQNSGQSQVLDSSVGSEGIFNSLQSFSEDAGNEIISFFSLLSETVSNGSKGMSLSTSLPALAAILWTGWVSCAYTIYAQSYGQSRVRPVTANLIYTVQPICTAIFAWFLLGEQLGVAGYLGGVCIGSAVLLVATEKQTTDEDVSAL